MKWAYRLWINGAQCAITPRAVKLNAAFMWITGNLFDTRKNMVRNLQSTLIWLRFTCDHSTMNAILCLHLKINCVYHRVLRIIMLFLQIATLIKSINWQTNFLFILTWKIANSTQTDEKFNENSIDKKNRNRFRGEKFG